MSYKIGQGYDVHQLKPKLPLILGGVDIAHSKGVESHSDGDVLIHSIIDAILGAYNLGDIGIHFPNTKEWENASGLSMLAYITKHIKIHYDIINIINIDSTIILEKPKLLQYIPKMKININEILKLKNGVNDISIKATTTDKLGFIGLEQGIAVQSVCLINY